jgi:rhodanese-related sulfurtransferase
MKTGKIIIGIIMFLATIIFIRAAYLYATDSPHRISSQKAKQLIQSNKFDVILDVRTNLERSSLGFYPGSTHIPSADIERMMPNQYPNKQTRILIYCNTGHRARMATDTLHALGYKNTVYISSNHTSLM